MSAKPPTPPLRRLLAGTFRPHFYVYLVVNAALTGLNVYMGAPWWAVWPLVLWGMILMLHFLYHRTAAVDEAWVEERTLDLRSRSYDLGHIEDIRDHPAHGVNDEDKGTH